MVTQAARSREAPLPQPGPDPARPRPVGEQVRRALGGDAQRPQEPTGGRHHGQRRNRFVCRGDGSRQRDRRLRDLHQDHPRAHLGGHHGSGAASEVQLRRSDQLRLDARLRVQGVGRPARSTSPPARTSRSTLPAASFRASTRCGATRSRTRALPGSHGRSSRSRTRAGSPSPTTSCPRARTHELYGGWPMILSGLKTLARDGRGADHTGLAALLRHGRLAEADRRMPVLTLRPYHRHHGTRRHPGEHHPSSHRRGCRRASLRGWPTGCLNSGGQRRGRRPGADHLGRQDRAPGHGRPGRRPPSRLGPSRRLRPREPRPVLADVQRAPAERAAAGRRRGGPGDPRRAHPPNRGGRPAARVRRARGEPRPCRRLGNDDDPDHHAGSPARPGPLGARAGGGHRRDSHRCRLNARTRPGRGCGHPARAAAADHGSQRSGRRSPRRVAGAHQLRRQRLRPVRV